MTIAVDRPTIALMVAEERALESVRASARPGHDIFVSYAHENVQQVQGLVEILELNGYTVAWDQRFDAVAPWDRQIERAIDRAHVAVIVLWSRASLKSDMVREEAYRARRRGRLLSTRLEDVDPPFPYALQQALDLQGFKPAAIDRLLDELKARKDALDPSKRVDVESSGPPGLTSPKSLRALRRRKRWLLQAGGVAAVVLTAVILAYAAGLPELLFSSDSKLRFASVWARSLLVAPLPKSPITYVPIGEETTATRLGPFGAQYRSAHAQILRAATRYGAKVVAFDVYFPPPRPPVAVAGAVGASDSDAGSLEFASAISEARAAGTAVVIGEERRGNTEPRIRSALNGGPPTSGTIATLCIALKGAYALSVPLLVATEREGVLEAAVPSLSLASFAAFVGADAGLPLLSADRSRLQMHQGAKVDPLEVTISGFNEVDATQIARCGFLTGRSESTATMIIDLPRASRYEPGPNVIEYAQLLAGIERASGTGTEAQKAASDLDAKLRGRLVLVAPREPNKDLHQVFGWHRDSWGSELHAYAIETLFAGRALRMASITAHVLLIVVLGSSGAFVRLYYRRDRRRRRLGLLVLLAANVLGLVVASVYLDLIVDAVYQTLAIVLMYLMCGRYVSPWSTWIAAKGSA